MARPGLAKLEVKQACEALEAQGCYPSADAVRRELGNRGSKSTIHRLLKQLQADARAPAAETTPSDADLRDAFAALLARVHAEHADQADQLRRQAVQIAYLSEQVQALQLRLAEDDRVHLLRPGFGDPYGLNDNNRAGRAGFSRIDSFFNSRSSSTSTASPGQNRGDPFWRI